MCFDFDLLASAVAVYIYLLRLTGKQINVTRQNDHCKKTAPISQHRCQARQAAGKQDYIVRKHTDIITKCDIKKNGTLFYTTIPMYEVREWLYKHQLHELELAAKRQKAWEKLTEQASA